MRESDLVVSDFGLRVSFGLRISDFGFSSALPCKMRASGLLSSQRKLKEYETTCDIRGGLAGADGQPAHRRPDVFDRPRRGKRLGVSQPGTVFRRDGTGPE